MPKKCACGTELTQKKRMRKHTVTTINPGKRDFSAVSVKCSGCGAFVFDAKDAEAACTAFDAAGQNK